MLLVHYHYGTVRPMNYNGVCEVYVVVRQQYTVVISYEMGSMYNDSIYHL